MAKTHNTLIKISLIIILLIYLPIFSSGHHRKILHQAFFPSEPLAPVSQPPRQQQQPKYPFSFTLSPFFPLPLSPPSPSPPPPYIAAAVTFPANFSGHRSKPKPVSRKLISIAVIVSLSAAAAVFFAAAVVLRRRRTHRKLSSNKPAPETSPATNVSGEILYLGTLRGVEEKFCNTKNGMFSRSAKSSAREYRRLSSPELRPIPHLPRHQPVSREFLFHEGEDDEEEQFFSPNLSPNNNNNNTNNNGNSNIMSSVPKVAFCDEGTNLRNNSGRSSSSSFPIDSMSGNSPFIGLNLSPSSLISNSPDLNECDFRAKPMSQNGFSSNTQNLFSGKECLLTKREDLSIPSPPPLPPPRFWEMFGPREGRQVAVEDLERGEEESGLKPRLKPLHWDTLRASSDKAMVWDQIKSSSFQLNEEMIETLFMVNDPTSSSSENTQRLPYAKLNQESRVLDPKKSQNVAILLRALNVTVDEVCEALIEGTTDTLGTELLESLLKMAPSKDEERKLKKTNDFSPTKLGPAEKFLKAILDIPFAFRRVDAMLYVVNFDSEVEYLKKSFETLKAACEELKNNRMFRKLLDAVLQTGNRINLGTDRGGARAFKLDTLLKLVEIKGTDGKTTLLHFVVQEVSQAEGSNLAKTNQHPSSGENKVELRKLGLCVVSKLSSELDNVKKAADTDLKMLSEEVARLSNGIMKIKDVMELECGERFSCSMNMFLDRAEKEIWCVRSLYMECLCLVKAITEYFHGESGKEEARIFTVVRDFIRVLDCVCKEVGKVNERSFVGSGCKQPVPVNPSGFLFPQQR